MADKEAARLARDKLLVRLRSNPRVVGIGIASRASGYVVKVNLSEPDTTLPASIARVPIETEIVGVVRSRARSSLLRQGSAALRAAK